MPAARLCSVIAICGIPVQRARIACIGCALAQPCALQLVACRNQPPVQPKEGGVPPFAKKLAHQLRCKPTAAPLPLVLAWTSARRHAMAGGMTAWFLRPSAGARSARLSLPAWLAALILAAPGLAPTAAA